MVRNHVLVATILSVVIFSGDALRAEDESPVVRSLRVVRCAPTTIKPCQQAVALFEIDLDRSADYATWRTVVGRLSQIVRVNGKEFRNRLSGKSGANDACAFVLVGALDGRGFGERGAVRRSGQVVGRLFLSTRERECLFAESGPYESEFSVDGQTATTTIVVEDPTPQEVEIVEFLNNMAVLLLMNDPKELKSASPELVTELVRLAKLDTDYSKMLSLAIGIGGILSEPYDRTMSEERHREWSITSSKELYAWMNPHLSDEIESPLEALATYRCGLLASVLSGDKGNARAAKAYEQRRDELWARVEASPMTFGEAKEVAIPLKAIREQRAATDE